MNSLQIFLSLLLIWFNLSQGYTSTTSNINTMTPYKKLSNSLSSGLPSPLDERVKKNSPEQESARTFNFNSNGDDDENNDDDIKTKWGISSDNLSWGTTSLVYWPPVLLVLGLLAIPTTLVILVVFIIPVITPERDEKTKRSLNNGYGHGLNAWKPIAKELAREIIFDSSKQAECIERISCELMTTVNSYALPLTSAASAFSGSLVAHENSSVSPLTNWIQKKISESSVLSDRLKLRISKSIQHSTKNDPNKISCQKYMCKPLERNNENDSHRPSISSKNNETQNENTKQRRKRKQRQRQRQRQRRTIEQEFESDDTILEKIFKYVGNRWIFNRKLAANKDVQWYPYLPSIG